jgi:hypothetical protein
LEDERSRPLAETGQEAQLYALVMLVLAAAARAAELLKLTWKSVETQRRAWTLKHTNSGEPNPV